MGETMISMGPAVGIAIALFAVVGAAVAWVGRTGLQWQIPWASVRAALQLIVLALVIGYVADRMWLVAAFVLVMSCTATWAAAKRISGHSDPAAPNRRPGPRDALWCSVPVVAPVLVVVLGLMAAGVVHPTGLSVIPVAGIYLGNAMTVTGLTGRRAHDELWSRRGEVEAALSLGFTDHQARLLVCREAASTALGPNLDQTRTIGLVTIPGAFVGMVLGGAEPWQAGVMQLFVSVGILAIGAVSLVVTTQLVAAGKV